MNERIKILREELHLSQEKFAERIMLTKNFVSLVETGQRSLSERSISLICEKFNVNETWLRTGEGDMFVKRSRDEEIAEFMGYLISDDSNPTMKRFIRAFSKLDPADWDVIQKIMDALLEEQEREQM